MANGNRTNNDPQNIAQKTKDRATRIQLKTECELQEIITRKTPKSKLGIIVWIGV